MQNTWNLTPSYTEICVLRSVVTLEQFSWICSLDGDLS